MPFISFRLVKQLIPLSCEVKFHRLNKLIDRSCNVATKEIKLKVNFHNMIHKERVFINTE